MLPQIVMTAKGALLLLVAIYAFASLLRPDDARWVKGAPLRIFVGLYVVAMWAHTPWVPFLLCLGVIPFFSRERAEAAALYVLTFLAVPVMSYKIVIGSHYLFAVDKYTFCALGLCVAYLIRKNSGPRLHRRFDIPIVIIMVLETAQARDPDLVQMMRELLPVLFTIAVPYYLLSRSLNTTEDVRRFVIAIALGGFVMAGVATVEARTHWLIYKHAESALGISSPVNAYQQMRAGILRAPASFPESTSLGAFLAAATVAVIALRTSFASWQRWYIAVGVLLIGLIAPNSRNALIGTAAGLILFDFYRRKWGALITKVSVVGLLYLILLTAAQFSRYAANLVGKGADTRSSNDYRVLLFKRGMEEIHKHPVLGTTMSKAMNNLQDIRQGQHIIDLVNGYITYGLTSGYMGMIGLLLVFVSLVAAMFSARRELSAHSMLQDIAAFVFAASGFMILVVAFTSFGGDGSTYFYLVAAVGSSLWTLRRRASLPKSETVSAPAAARSSSRASDIRGLILADRSAAHGRRDKASSAPTA